MCVCVCVCVCVWRLRRPASLPWGNLISEACWPQVFWCRSQSRCWQNEPQYRAVLQPLHVSEATRPQFQHVYNYEKFYIRINLLTRLSMRFKIPHCCLFDDWALGAYDVVLHSEIVPFFRVRMSTVRKLVFRPLLQLSAVQWELVSLLQIQHLLH